jgi:hypothetical protein
MRSLRHQRRRVCLTSLITRRCYPTTDHPCRRVGKEHRQVSNWNPTTTNTSLMLDTPAIVGFVGLFGRYERGYPRESGRRGIGKWCSEGPQGMV